MHPGMHRHRHLRMRHRRGHHPRQSQAHRQARDRRHRCEMGRRDVYILLYEAHRFRWVGDQARTHGHGHSEAAVVHIYFGRIASFLPARAFRLVLCLAYVAVLALLAKLGLLFGDNLRNSNIQLDCVLFVAFSPGLPGMPRNPSIVWFRGLARRVQISGLTGGEGKMKELPSRPIVDRACFPFVPQSPCMVSCAQPIGTTLLRLLR